MKRLPAGVVLTLVVLGGWVVFAGPAYWLAGPNGLSGSALAGILCLAPGWLVFWICSRYRVPHSQAMAILAGMTVRMVVVLFGTLLVRELAPWLGFWSFFVWLIAFYLVTLLCETLLLLKQQASLTSGGTSAE